jgi:hypothetical protein
MDRSKSNQKECAIPALWDFVDPPRGLTTTTERIRVRFGREFGESPYPVSRFTAVRKDGRNSMERKQVVRLAAVGALLALALPMIPSAAAGGAQVNLGAGIWADGQQWGTVGTPAVIAGNQSLSFFDELVKFPNSNAVGGQNPVAERAPGDFGYHGGNWASFGANWTSAGFSHYGGTVPLLTSFTEVEAAVAAGYLTLTQGDPFGGPAFFRCPLTAFQS